MTSSNDNDPDQGSPDGEDTQYGANGNDTVPRPKRIACILCRKRKLRCDGSKPSCGTCSRLNHHCEYSEERKKSGPKRGYVKLLEARLKQVENLLETRDTSTDNAPHIQDTTSSSAAPAQQQFMSTVPIMDPDLVDSSMQGILQDTTFTDPTLGAMPDFGINTNDDFSWEMIGLGLEEALPSRDVIDELYGRLRSLTILVLTISGMKYTSTRSIHLSP